jgi:tetratricopeptide (TPR) repeat protein
MQAQSEAARGYYQQALKRSETIGDQLGQANALRGVGAVALRQDQSEAARGYYQQALNRYETIGDQLGQAHALYGLCQIWLKQQETGQAVDALQRLVQVVGQSELHHLSDWRTRIHDIAK